VRPRADDVKALLAHSELRKAGWYLHRSIVVMPAHHRL
jgi:hypothetical protein